MEAQRLSELFDIPVGVAKTNGLLRVTEISDEGAFKTPFLLPISYIELVGAAIDTNTEQFILRSGRSTPVKRVSSGHHTEQLREELNLKDGNPFALPKKHMRKNVSLRQQPGVAAWLKTDDSAAVHGNLERGAVLHWSIQKETFSASAISTLKRSRVTVASFSDMPSASPMSHNMIHGNMSNSANFLFGRVMCFLSNCRFQALRLAIFAILALL